MKTKISKVITYEELIKVLEYDPITGLFIWRETRGSNAIKGSVAGNKSPSGYMDIKVGGSTYRQHRLAWLYIYGVWPTDMIDHIDRDKTNNRISNLRDVPRSVNALNSKIRSDNTSGYKGVSKLDNGYISQLSHNGEVMYLGLYLDINEAVAVREAKVKELGILC